MPISPLKQDMAIVSHDENQRKGRDRSFFKLESLLQQARYHKFYEALATTLNEVFTAKSES